MEANKDTYEKIRYYKLKSLRKCVECEAKVETKHVRCEGCRRDQSTALFNKRAKLNGYPLKQLR
jgi:hypothetical protein